MYIFLSILLGIAALILLCAVILFVLWKNEILTLLSIRKIYDADAAHKDGYGYRMRFYGDYYFDDYLKRGGAKTDKELQQFLAQKITRNIFKMNINSIGAGCSSFTCKKENGDRLFCRNFDLSPSNSAIVHTKPGHGRYASVSTIDLKFLGIPQNRKPKGLKEWVKLLGAPYVPMDGMNEAGLSASIYICVQGKEQKPTRMNEDKPNLTSSTFIRYILDYCKTVEEAVAVAQKFNMNDSSNNSFHYSVTDATGKSAVLEWIGKTNATDTDPAARHLVVTYNEGGNCQVVTNYVIAAGYYSPEDKIYGLDRQMTIQENLGKTSGIVRDEDEAMKVLSLTGRRSMDSKSVTLHSVVYNMTSHRVLWVANEHYGEEKYTFRYKI